ncbi:MAG: DUF4407 domain-containing protein [Bacteroidales bacterium]
MTIFRNFFWFCSGAHIALLKRCPTESSKYAGIGGTVLSTGVFAAISSSYALYTVFRQPWIAIGFGLVWGSMIFNLDRYIVSSMKKRSHFLRELGMAFPRLMLAVLLAFVISKPLELKIFEREILREIDQKKTQQLQLTKEAVFESFPEIEEKQQQVAELRREIILKEEFRNQKQTEYDWERFGVATSGTSGIPGIGRNARLKEQQLEEARQDLMETRRRNQEKIDQLEKEIAVLYENRSRHIELQQATIDNYDGFAARIDALGALTRQSRAIYLANLFIILLFIAVETAPILVKLISPRGPYDDLLEKHEHVFSKYRLEHMTRLEQRTLENITILEEQSRNALRKEKDVSRTSFREMTDAEIEIARKTIQRWKELELEKLSQMEELQSTTEEKADSSPTEQEKD